MQTDLDPSIKDALRRNGVMNIVRKKVANKLSNIVGSHFSTSKLDIASIILLSSSKAKPAGTWHSDIEIYGGVTRVQNAYLYTDACAG